MNRVLTILQNENRRLLEQAEHDWLTGLYNRRSVEEKVNNRLKVMKSGVLFILDIDRFKSINDRFGHLAGDQVLQGVALILEKMVFRNDILGRIGGDEFVVFMGVSPGPDFIEERCRQIKQQFLNLPCDQFMVNKLSVTVCGSRFQKGDDYQSLFDRADQSLIKEKSLRRKRPDGMDDKRELLPDIKSLKIDMEQLNFELSEYNPKAGAFCLDYDSFVNVYRFVARRLQRVKSSVYSLLFTLVDEKGDFPGLYDRILLMEELHQMIQMSLRAGDVFTRYSSCQYLVMVSDAAGEQADAIAERIREKFEKSSLLAEKYRLISRRYPLKAPEVRGRK